MSAMGGIGQQVAGDLFELGKGVVKSTAKVVTDTVGDSIEQILGAPTGTDGAAKEGQKNLNSQPNRDKEREDLTKKREEKKRYQDVKAELEEFVQRKKQLDAQIVRDKAQDEQEHKQKENYEKQKKESFLQGLMKRLAGGSHGETDRQKE